MRVVILMSTHRILRERVTMATRIDCITLDPAVMGGKPSIRGLRMTTQPLPMLLGDWRNGDEETIRSNFV